MRLSKSSVTLLLILGLASTGAIAGTTGNEFQNLFNKLLGWASGYLGKALSVAAFIIGAGIGIAKSTIMPAVIGVVFALTFSIGPGIITSMLSALV